MIISLKNHDTILRYECCYLKMAEYTKLNPKDVNGARELFRLRVGFNCTNLCKFIRHQTKNTICEHCDWQIQDEKHLIKDCPRFNNERTKLLMNLKTCIDSDEDLNLMDVVLDSWRYEEKKNKLELTRSQADEIDAHAKEFIKIITKSKKLRRLGRDKT
ncbi:unnamed protein product [Blepharisma stoltei]|uniref:Reverse transcriptase zinc-binding domain-containing protein n=1 Tax=Blepharisma stoltei TaxID=1481888 RepID=A0AAU9JB80_9CILI|nr:unnamed protein product [Blepharisma stoltei]